MEEQVATIVYESRRRQLAYFYYLLERFHLGGGRTTFSGLFPSWFEVSSHQNSEISVALSDHS